MSQEVMNIIETCVISPLLIAITYYVVAFIHKQTVKLQETVKNEKIKNLIGTAEGIVAQAVNAVSQTYVDALKADGTFDKDAQINAFEKSKSYIYTLLTEDTINVIKQQYGNLDTWVTTKIEESIYQNK